MLLSLFLWASFSSMCSSYTHTSSLICVGGGCIITHATSSTMQAERPSFLQCLQFCFSCFIIFPSHCFLFTVFQKAELSGSCHKAHQFLCLFLTNLVIFFLFLHFNLISFNMLAHIDDYFPVGCRHFTYAGILS